MRNCTARIKKARTLIADAINPRHQILMLTPGDRYMPDELAVEGIV